MKKCANKQIGLFFSILLFHGAFVALVLISPFNAFSTEEMYIITTRKGLEITVKNYTFTDEYVEFTTPNDLPGFIKKAEFVKITNMVGVPPAPAPEVETIDNRKEREIILWLMVGAALFALYIVFLVFVIGKKKKGGKKDVDIYYGRVEKEPVTQGHLAFDYHQSLGRKSAQWVIVVENAYEEDGILYVVGTSTESGKQKTFRADRVDVLVTDVSKGREGLMDNFFTDSEKE